jgi:hypothetical protein
MVHRLAPRRPRLHALAAQKLSVNLVRRGPATAWELYRLSTRRDWLDHRRAIPLLENPSSATEMPSADVPGQLVHEDQDRPVTGSASASSPAPRARDRSRLTTSASANRAASLERIRRDRILHEALAAGAGPLHLALVFNIDHTNVMAYASAARNLLTSPAGQGLSRRPK